MANELDSTPMLRIAGLEAAVVGAGTIGRGIAMTYANAGIPVMLQEQDDERMTSGWRVRCPGFVIPTGKLPAVTV